MADLVLLDVTVLLDTSKVGQAAAQELAKTWTAAKAEPEAKRRDLYAELDKKRDGLRKALLARAKPIIEAAAKKRGAKVVLEKAALHWTDPSVEDITAAVIAELDKGGPLKP